MTSFRPIEANHRNARKSAGSITEEGKQRSRCNAVRRGLTAETVIGALEDAEDYKAFKTAVVADYDAQSAVERGWCCGWLVYCGDCGRATTMGTGLFQSKRTICVSLRGAANLNRSRRKLCMQGSGMLILLMPTSIEHRSAL